MNKINPLFRLVGLLAASLPLTATAAAAVEQRPNIIIVFTDDQGWTDLGIHGIDPDVRTPNLDQLARDGVLFTNGYVTAPQCVPSRAGIMTGRHQNAFGMDDNHKGPLPLTEITMADRLQAAGYATGMVGKWHLAPGRNRTFPDGKDVPDAKYDPGHRGFEEYWNGPMVNYQANFDLQGNLIADAPQTINDPRFRIVVQTQAALAFLKRREQDDRSFFLYLAYFAPHAPMQASPPHMQRARSCSPTPRAAWPSVAATVSFRSASTPAKSTATGFDKFIYTPAPAPKPTPNIHAGEWTTFDLDLLPAMREGFAVARGRGYLQHLDGADDYRLGGMNLGWEMPGTYDVELQIRNLRLTAIPAPGHG